MGCSGIGILGPKFIYHILIFVNQNFVWGIRLSGIHIYEPKFDVGIDFHSPKVKFDVSISITREIVTSTSNLSEGANGLRSILEANLMDTIFSFPSINIKSFQLDAKKQKFLINQNKSNALTKTINS